MRFGLALAVSSLCLSLFGSAQNLNFDLAGPSVDVRVQRTGNTLPIAEVASLAPGDRLWVHPDLPDSQSARYLMIIAFLRGSTNPPPDRWFIRAETWDKQVHEEGFSVIVPDGAEQVVIFLAPQNAGDFGTVKAAVQGRPGAFVRAIQDLQQASLDHMRLERYLTEIKSASDANPAELQQRSTMLARSLQMKLDTRCFDKLPQQQAACLTQNSDRLVLDDAHSRSMLTQLASGDTAILMNQISASRLAGGGAYSTYVGAIVDFARIMGSLRSPQYQYIPALALPHADSLSLKLNTPPSFRKPKSVLVIALPTIKKVDSPPIRTAQPSERLCAEDPTLVLPADGAPLVFATSLAHDLYLHVADQTGHSAELPVIADPVRGGFVVQSSTSSIANFTRDAVGIIHGFWGFDSFRGPQYKLEVSHPQTWKVLPSDTTALIVGRKDSLHIAGRYLACISSIQMRTADGSATTLNWRVANSGMVEIDVPLQEAVPGTLFIEVNQYAQTKPDVIALNAYAEAPAFNSFTLSTGDAEGTLNGNRLDEVTKLEFAGMRFDPGKLGRRNDHDELRLKTTQSTDALEQTNYTARVTLNDGRTFAVLASVLPPRPLLTLISKGVQTNDVAASPIRLGSDDDLPTNGRIVFFLKSIRPQKFSRDERIEIAANDNSFHTILRLSDGSLVLQDAQTALGILDPQKSFGASAFGSVRFRAITKDGRQGDWQHLGTLVRIPELKEVYCPPSDPKTCFLSGTNLFLLAAVATNPDFDPSTNVPDGFTGQALAIPRIHRGIVYLRLRDDPAAIQTATLPIVHTTVGPEASTVRSDQTSR
jgi:hypothetical protein